MKQTSQAVHDLMNLFALCCDVYVRLRCLSNRPLHFIKVTLHASFKLRNNAASTGITRSFWNCEQYYAMLEVRSTIAKGYFTNSSQYLS